MATPLTHLLQRSKEDWIISYSTQELIQLTQKRYQEITPKIQTILLAERDPIWFLASFIAACSSPCHLFLCNPDWTETEWQQVFNLVQPDLIWGKISAEWITSGNSLNRTNQPSASSVLSSVASLIMIPTGGTSGKVRFAMHTWKTLVASVQGFKEHFEVDRIHSFCVLPLYHVSGLMQFMRSFTSGGKLVILPWKTLETGEENITNPQDCFLSLVPTQLQKLLHPTPRSWLSQFKTILLGGAPAGSELLREARSLQLAIAPTYGMTETASQVATLKPEEFLRDNFNCGRVLPHAQITIRNSTNQLLEAEQIGRITIQANSLMLGYYPKLSNALYYEPDDLGFFDAQGYLHIVGRDSNKIITGGENVFPAEVEAAILATKMVRDVCVIGISDPVWGQIVSAVYVPELDTSHEKLAIALEGKLSKFKRPKCWIAIAHLPRNSQGKINCDQLRQVIAAKMNTPATPAKA